MNQRHAAAPEAAAAPWHRRASRWSCDLRRFPADRHGRRRDHGRFLPGPTGRRQRGAISWRLRRDEPRDTIGVQRRTCGPWATPDDASLVVVSVIKDALFGNLIGSIVLERGREHEDDLVCPAAFPVEDVLQDSKQPDITETLAYLLQQFPMHRIFAAFAKLDVTAERPLKRGARLISVLGHQQSPVAWPADHRHRLDNLSALTAHDAVLPRQLCAVVMHDLMHLPGEKEPREP